MFCGRVEFSGGVWAGIEISNEEGKHDGSVAGIAYFKCPPKSGTNRQIIPVTKITSVTTVGNV